MRKKREEHPEDVFLASLDRALNGCLRELTPWLGKKVPTWNGKVEVESAYPEVEMTVAELKDRMIQHLHTHLGTELTIIETGDEEELEQYKNVGHGRSHIIYRLARKRGGQ